MESPQIPMKEIIEGLKKDSHICDKELFSFVNRMLNSYDHITRVMWITEDHVQFAVVEIDHGTT